jgi:isopentenyl-diphosphate delta-isomerase
VVADREDLLVELVDEAGTAIGACSVAEAHAAPGRPHRAFSVLVFDQAGRVLVQRRAAAKTRFASRWSNTCCGHQAPGQDTVTAAARRLAAELGLTPEHTTDLREVGVLSYEARDPASDRVEREWDHILVATLTGGHPVLDEAEVSEFAWTGVDSLRLAMTARPGSYTPWFAAVLNIAASAS